MSNWNMNITPALPGMFSSMMYGGMLGGGGLLGTNILDTLVLTSMMGGGFSPMGMGLFPSMNQRAVSTSSNAPQSGWNVAANFLTDITSATLPWLYLINQKDQMNAVSCAIRDLQRQTYGA
ncbi:MAG: hypothetical protein ABIH00_01035 [Armatimonadota bacterium]